MAERTVTLKRLLEGILDDRMAHRLRRRAEGLDNRDEQDTSAQHDLRRVVRPARRDNGAARRKGRGRADGARIPAPPRLRGQGDKPTCRARAASRRRARSTSSSTSRGSARPCAEVAEYLLDEAKIALVPGSVFGVNGEGYLRMSFANSLDNIAEGCERMKAAFARLAVK